MLQFRRGLTRALLLQAGHVFFSLPHANGASSSTAGTASFNVTSPSSTLRSNTSSTSVSMPTPSPSKPFQPPGSFPQVYGNMPSGEFNTEWQDCLSSSVSDNPTLFSLFCETDYLVTEGLPSITFPLPRNFAGNIPVNRAAHPNNTLFFWGFETNVGSLTAPATQLQLSPWMIWLGGGGG